MNIYQAPLKPVMDLLEHVRDNRVLQISGEPKFSVQSALNILSGIDSERSLDARTITRTEKIKQMLGWNADPQYSVLRGIDEAALNWAYNEGYFDQPLHVHTAAKLPDHIQPVQIASENIIVVHSAANGSVSIEHHKCERLLMLYIQATHEQMKRQPIVLSGSGLSLYGEQQLNTWSFAFPSTCVDVGSFVLRKNFAEVYASIILLIGTEGSEDAQCAVRALIDRNSNLQTTWNGEDDVWQHHLGTSILQTVLEKWNTVAKMPSSDIWTWVEHRNSMAFGGWLKQQPLAQIAVEELIPTFEKRVIDLAGQHSQIPTPSSEPLYNTLNDLRVYLQSKWTSPLNPSDGIMNLLHKTIQRTGVAVGWLVNHDPKLQDLSQSYNAQRSNVVANVVAEFSTSDPTLRSRLEQYRKGIQAEPYVLPPTP